MRRTTKATSQTDGKAQTPLLKVKGGPQFWGVVEYSSAWKGMDESQYPIGVYKFLATNPGEMTQLLNTGQNGPNAGGVFYDGSFHYVNYYLMYETQPITYTYDYDTSTWQQNGYAQYGSDATIIGTDLAYDATTKNVYGYFYNPLDDTEPMRFGTITYSEYGASTQTIATEDTLFICLAANKAGQLYGISWGGGLWKIDKATGAKTLVDYTGVRPSSFRQSATFDPKTDKLYWTAFREDYSSGLYEVNTANGAASLIAEIPDSMEISCLHIPEPEAEDGAPAAVNDLSVKFEGGSLTGQATFTMPSETYSGDALTGSLTYNITANGETIKTGTADAGSTVNTEIEAKGGNTEFAVTAENAEGKSPESNKQKLWVGYDVPQTPQNVKLEVDAESRKATLSWDAPTSSVNGGYFDAEAITYNVVRYPGQVAVATDIKETSFSETLPDQQLTAYYYTVTACNGGVKGEAAQSDKAVVGTAFNVPFSDNFESDDTYNLYSIVDSNNDGTTWKESYHAFSYFYSWTNNADDWLLTPPIKLEGGHTYKFAFDIRCGSSYDTEKFATAYGLGTDPTQYTELSSVQELNSSSYTTIEKTLQVGKSGEYRFGIHALSDANKSGLTVSDFSVTAVSKSSVPDSVSALSITPATLGELKATISFNAPDKDRDKQPLNELTKIEVWRNGTDLIKTFDSPKVGQSLQCEDSQPVNGINKYTVVGYNSGGKGAEVTDSAYVGQDVPTAPQNVKLVDNGNGITLTWDAPSTKGTHGGYVTTANLAYNIYDAEGYSVAEGVKGTSWSNEMNLEAQDNVIYFNVSAVTEGGEGATASSTYLVTGKPTTLPYHESFANGGTTKTLWWTVGNNPYNPFSFSPETSYDHDMGSAYWFGIDPGDRAELNSGKISLAGTDSPALFFSYYATPGKDMNLSVVAETSNGDALTMDEYSFKDMDGKEGWRKAAVFFDDAVKQARYFVLKFIAEAGDDSPTLFIDDITMRDVPAHDLSATLESPTSATEGKAINAKVTVSNNGEHPAEGFTVNLYAGDELVDSEEIEQLAFNADTTASLKFAPKLGSEGTMEIHATVDYAEDNDLSNNTTNALEVAISKPDYPSVDDLKAERTTDGVDLAWSKPSTDKPTTTETFDSYDPWLTDGIGEWGVADGDRMQTNAYTSMWYPHIGEEMAYIVFNNRYAIMDVSQEPVFTPHSGEQCLAAFATVHDYSKDVPTDDWLITPELSGDAQTVSFYIKSLTDYKEDFYVYYSTQNGDTASLKANRIAFEKFGAESSWKKYEYELPQGAKYFGVRYTSNLSGILIDDFSYEGKKLTRKGYNIYRDGQKIGSAEAGATAFSDDKADGGSHDYTVTVVYAEGESAFSNIAEIATGIANVTTDGHVGDIYTANGIKVGHGKEAKDRLKQGVYIINGRKVVVK